MAMSTRRESRRLPRRCGGIDERGWAWIIAMSICDELNPLGAVIVPPRASAEQEGR